jgi:hypothetical protein
MLKSDLNAFNEVFNYGSPKIIKPIKDMKHLIEGDFSAETEQN